MTPQKEDQRRCEICRDSAEMSRAGTDVVEIQCRRCGHYRLSGSARAALEAGEWRGKAWVLACVTRNASVASRAPLLLTTQNIQQLIDDAPLPTSPIEVMDRLLLDLISLHRGDGGFSGPITLAHDKHVFYYLPSPQDLGYVLKGLERLGYAQGVQDRAEARFYILELTVDGWAHAAELEKSTVQTWQAFVAMQFAPALDSAYDDGIKPALIDTGYAPFRADRVHYNDKIDDRIVAQLRRSGLIVADFTGHRGGVYFEAGYAMGRGAHVIWSCRKDDIGRAHFDTRQYNHIVWTEPTELRELLTNRIRATLPFRDVRPARIGEAR